MKELLKKYNIREMIEVVSDRAEDYGENCKEYEEEYRGEMDESGEDLYYEYGYGKTLDDVVELLEELNNLQ